MRFVFLQILIFVFQGTFSQNVRVLEASGFTHNYIVPRATIIEDAKDTARLKFVASLELTGPHNQLPVVATWLDLLRIKARELNASHFFVSSYGQDSAIAMLKVKLYFGGRWFEKLNESKMDSSHVYVFNQYRITGDSAFVLADQDTFYFDPLFWKKFDLPVGKTLVLATNKNNITSRKVKLDKSGTSKYFIVPYFKKDFRNARATTPGSTALYIGGVNVTFSGNKPFEIDYQTGRFVLAAYQ